MKIKIKKTKIILDEKQLQPKFLKELNLSEMVLKEETDEQSLSIQELQKIPAEQLQSELQKMKNGESQERLKARIAKHKELDQALKKAQFEKEDIEFSNDIFVDFYHNVKNLLRSLFGKKAETRLQLKEKEIEKIIFQLKDAITKSYTPLQREIFRAIGLFTGANYPTIRDPEKFDSKKAKFLRIINDGVEDSFAPTKETYKKAKIILNKLVNSKIKPVKVWRGMNISEKTGKFPGLESYAVGKTINVGNLSSFSTAEDVAWNFVYPRGEQEGWATILHIPSLTKGADVDEFSAYEGTEKEIIVSGDFKILKMFYLYPPAFIDGQKVQINSFNELKKMIENNKLEKPITNQLFKEGKIFIILKEA